MAVAGRRLQGRGFVHARLIHQRDLKSDVNERPATNSPGILNALMRISLSGQPSLDQIARPIGEALVMTAIGLFVAAPAVIG